MSGAFASLDGIIVTGPPGTPPGTVVGYTVNLFVTANLSASHSGTGAPYAVADGRVRFGTGSSLGFFGGVDLGNLHVQSDGTYVGHGIFSNLPPVDGQGFAVSSTSWLDAGLGPPGKVGVGRHQCGGDAIGEAWSGGSNSRCEA